MSIIQKHIDEIDWLIQKNKLEQELAAHMATPVKYWNKIQYVSGSEFCRAMNAAPSATLESGMRNACR